MSREQIRVVAAVVEREGRYLITQRRAEAVLGLLWEFPGGKVEPGESDEAALARELGEKLGVTGTVGRKLGERHHAYDGYDVDFALYSVKLDENRPPFAKHVKEFRWVTSKEFDQYRFPDADQQTMDQLLGITR